ncbi:hypothetical protein CR513_01788, partial [Mucuna pruriens]
MAFTHNSRQITLVYQPSTSFAVLSQHQLCWIVQSGAESKKDKTIFSLDNEYALDGEVEDGEGGCKGCEVEGSARSGGTTIKERDSSVYLLRLLSKQSGWRALHHEAPQLGTSSSSSSSSTTRGGLVSTTTSSSSFEVVRVCGSFFQRGGQEVEVVRLSITGHFLGLKSSPSSLLQFSIEVSLGNSYDNRHRFVHYHTEELHNCYLISWYGFSSELILGSLLTIVKGLPTELAKPVPIGLV